jgi:hypothetical protein
MCVRHINEESKTIATTYNIEMCPRLSHSISSATECSQRRTNDSTLKHDARQQPNDHPTSASSTTTNNKQQEQQQQQQTTTTTTTTTTNKQTNNNIVFNTTTTTTASSLSRLPKSLSESTTAR